MTDKEKAGYDPANQAPAEGQSHPIPAEERGKNPGVDPADKAPAEGEREDDGQGSSTRK